MDSRTRDGAPEIGHCFFCGNKKPGTVARLSWSEGEVIQATSDSVISTFQLESHRDIPLCIYHNPHRGQG